MPAPPYHWKAGCVGRRFLWVWTSLRFTLLRATLAEQKVTVPSWRLIAVTSLAGVRGAITLAGVMTLPLTLNDGSAFPTRDLAIFLAAGVIIVSLIAGSLRLPHLLRGLKLPPEPSHQEDEDRARVAARKRQFKRSSRRSTTWERAAAIPIFMQMLARGSWNSIASVSTGVRRPGRKAFQQTLRRRSQAGQRSRFARGARRDTRSLARPGRSNRSASIASA
jgi:monovalent cation/hydrogen antiporter